MAGSAQQNGDNIIDRATTGAAAGGIGNEPAFPNDNAPGIPATPGSNTFAGVAVPSIDSGGVEQAFAAAGANATNPAGLPEQDYAKPTDSASPSALGPGMSQRG